MEDERWTTKDKIEQFRGVTGLYDSTAATIREKTSTLRKKQNKDIKNLTKQNKRYRQQYEEMLHGDKANLLPALHTHPKLQLAFKNLNPQQIEEELKQSIFCKSKELDRLRYKKKTLEDVYLNKKLELAELQKDVEDAPENYLWEQEIANQIQSVSVKLNTARANKDVHEKALNILQKDAIRFDQVLGALSLDLEHQCESIIKAEDMGQNVAEELDRLQREYKQTEKEVRANMKQRDRAIRSLRADIDNLRLHGYSVTRESRSNQAANLADEDSREGDVQALLDMHIKREIEMSEKMLSKVKEACKVHRVQDIIPRIEEQKKRKEWLTKQVTQNEEQLARMLELHSQLEVMLEVVMYQTMTEEAVQLKEERVKLRAGIEAEMESLKDTQKELTTLGDKIVDVRTALLTLNMMLDTVYPGIEELLFDMNMSRSSETLSQGIKPLFQPNTEALTLMEQVTKKVKWLVELVGPKALQGRPQTVCTFAVASASSKVGAEDDADNIVSDMLDELDDMDDPSVKTRKDIKADSQRIVDIYDNPQRMFQDDKGPKFKKHKCF